MVEYLTGTGHYGYECIPNRYGSENFSNDDQLNRYLNCFHYLDSFLNNLFEDLVAWRSKVDTEYGDTLTNGTLYSEE